MANKKDFGEGLLFTISNYVWWFLLTNIYFLLVNFLFVFVWIISAQAGAQGFNLPLIITALPIGPAFAALFSVMGKLIRDKDLNVTKDFFQAYKKNFKEALFFWGIIITMLTIIYIDLVVIKAKLNFPALSITLIVIGVSIISMAFYIFPIISRFYLRIRDVIKLSFIYSVRKIHITLSCWVILIGLVLMQTKLPGIMLLFMWSIFGYLIMFLQVPMLKELQEKITKKSESSNIE